MPTQGKPGFWLGLLGGLLLTFPLIAIFYLGDLDGLVALLSKDVVFHSDGGGKAPALPNPVYGSVNVGRAILGGLQRLVPKGLVSRTAEINGKPGIISYLDGRPYAVLTIDIVEGFIASIYIVSNPEKLERLPRPNAPS